MVRICPRTPILQENQLTQSEIDVLNVIRQGKTKNRDIAEYLGVSERVIKARLNETFSILGIETIDADAEGKKIRALTTAMLKGMIKPFD